MDEEDDKLALVQRCNGCWDPKQQLYMTTCNHLFCAECAQRYFTQGPHCPVCARKLTRQDIKGPVDVGILAPDSADAFMLKSVFSSRNYQEIVQQAIACLLAVEDAVSLVMTQLFLEVMRGQSLLTNAQQKAKADRAKHGNETNNLKSKLVRAESRAYEAESHKQQLGDEVATLKMQMEELRRKNKAMEKAMIHLRAEGHSIPSIHGLPMPISSPQSLSLPAPMGMGSPRRMSVSSSAAGPLHPRHHNHHHHVGPPPPSPAPNFRIYGAGGGSSGGGGSGGLYSTSSHPGSGTPSSSSGGGGGQRGILGGGNLASRHSPYRSSSAPVSSSSMGYPGTFQQPSSRSPKPGAGLGMRF